MSTEVTVPNLPESVQNATLLDWRKQPGDTVVKGETLVELETDKVVLDVPAPQNGIMGPIMRSKGDIVIGGDMLAVIEAAASPEAQLAAVSSLVETVDSDVGTGVGVAPEKVPPRPESAALPPESSNLFAQVSPSVRRLIKEHNLDPAQIRGSGKDARLTKQDILDYLEANKSGPGLAAAPAPVSVGDQGPFPAAADRRERHVPMTRLRARIAERLIESQRSTATLTTFNEVNMQKVFEVRNLYKARFEQEHKIKLGYMSFFVKATVEALKRFPIVNASIEGDEIVYHDFYDIGIAVSSDRGLVVPVLRDADKLDFGAIEKSVLEFSSKAREGKLSFEELSGGTFTITNGGIFGSMLSTPILNPPQSGILGLHAIKDRPVVENGQIVIRPMLYLALSYDHRLIDGRDAVLFLYTVKELLEDPVRMVLSV